jgi:outer membrane protein assembly factor BamB
MNVVNPVGNDVKRNEKERESYPVLYWIARSVAPVAAVFALFLSLLMIVNFIQIKSADPFNSPALSSLMQDVKENPENEVLKEQIRALDLLARKAYFTHRWQLRTGSYLLFAFVLVFLIAQKYVTSFRAWLPDLKAGPRKDNSWEIRILSKKSIQAAGAGLFVLAFVLGLLSQSDLRKIGRPGASAGAGYASLKEMRDNWPNFRGPGGLGVAYHTDVPREWDGASGQNIRWKTEIPLPGYNSPVIWEKRIFLSGGDRNNQAVFCLDADSGEILWRTDVKDVPGAPAEKPRPTQDTGFAAPTAATDGRRVFVIFATGDIAGLDYEGKILWARNLGLPDNHYGHSSSLITYEDILLVQFDQNSGGRLLGLSAASGDTVYDVPREVGISWASPILADTGDGTELILNSNPDVVSHDPRTGREIWRVRCMQGEIAPSLAYADGWVYAVNEYARLAGIRLEPEPEVVWEYIDDLSEVSSPVAGGGMVFMAASFGVLSCIDGRTGERYWYQDYDEGFYSSPVLAGDLIYLTDMSGVTFIIKAAREYEEVGRCELGETVVAVPAFMHGRIYMRGTRHLYCIGE